MTTLDERVVDAATGALEMFAMHIGRELGLYKTLATAGEASAAEMAAAAGIDARYALEWLEQQAVAGYITVAGDAEVATERTFSLDETQKALLVRPDDPAHVSPISSMVVGVGAIIDQVVDAYRTGDGVPYAHYGRTFREGQGSINRPAFTHDLVGSWIPSVPGLDDRLRGEGVRIADLGAGHGWSTVALAQGYPRATVVGLDSDEASMIEAREIAEGRGIAVDYVVADATELADHGPFDCVTVLECLHDMADPASVLVAARKALGPDGIVLLADECVADHFAPEGDGLERMMYGWSVVHCLPASRCETPSAAIGTVIRRSTVEQLAADAGFADVTVADVDAGFFRLYVLTP